jgi:hypothetical protein
VAARLLIVVALLGLFAVAPTLYRRRQRRLAAPTIHPSVPATLTAGAERTWVLFTTPWCASCGPVEEQLRALDPTARFVKVDATQDRALAADFSVRSAPTALLADRNGEVQARLVGPEAVSQFVAG